MADVNAHVKRVIEVLHDGHKGFADISEHLESSELKSFFLRESSTRETFAHELEATAGVTEEIGGTSSGALHRTWADLKAHLGGGDHTLLETAEQGEDAAKKAYKEALEDPGITGAERQVLSKQQPHIVASHDTVKAFRDSLK